MAKWVMVSRSRGAALKAMRFKDPRPTKAPHNVVWMIDPIPLMDGVNAVIPYEVLSHPRYRSVKGELEKYQTRDWTKTQEDVNLDNKVEDR